MRLANLLGTIIPAAKRSIHPLIVRHHQHFTAGSTFPGLMADYEFVVVDTELTGFSRKHDEIVAIGAVRIKKMQIVCGETFYALVRPEGPAHTRSTLVHRLTPQELRKAATMAEVLPRFVNFCGTAFLVGHFVRLDLEFLNRAARRHMGGILTAPYLDTMGLAMTYNDLQSGVASDHSNRQAAYTLAALSKEYGLSSFVEHNALQDAFQTAYLFLYLVRKIQHYDKRTLDDFLEAGRTRSRLWWHF